MSDLNDKHIAVLRKAAAAVKDRGHDGDARLADSVLGIVASLSARRAPAAAPAPVAAITELPPELNTLLRRYSAALHNELIYGESETASMKRCREYAAKTEAARESLVAGIIAALAAAPAAAPIVQPVGEPVAMVDAGDDGMFASILPDRSVKVGQYLYASPSSTTDANDAARLAFTADAESWGSALNAAAWEFVEQCPEKSALLFNTCKPALRAAILKYSAAIASSAGEVKP